jgi:hypothetical protein
MLDVCKFVSTALLLLSIFLFCSSSFAQTNQYLLLADVDGFEDSDIYPIGNLGAVTDGGATWQPASQTPGLITNVTDGHGVALRRKQTGVDNLDYIHFPAVSNGTLTVQFDARASTNGPRTLDVFVHPTSGGETSLLGLGTVTNKICYYNGTDWIPLTNLDTNWHQYEMINYLSGSNFQKWDLKMDSVILATNLPWRNNHPLGTAYSRVRFGGIRGVVNTYADVDNVVISAVVPYTPPQVLLITNATGSTGKFALSFQSKTNTEYLVETASSPAAVKTNDWTPLAFVQGNGSEARFTNQFATNSSELYRVKQMPAPGFADGYRGIWFTLGQFSTYGDKYSGGLGTYTANHIPIAIYCEEVNKTFFVYGGTIKDQRHLLIMASYYDHATQQVPRPTVVLDKLTVNDPHDNAALAIDNKGFIWIFVSGRATARPGWIFRSRKPYSVADFDFIKQDEMTYPQPRYISGFGFFTLFTKYTNGRELYWMTSTNGVNWTPHQKLAGIGGHYQVSNVRDSDHMIASFFNRHPGGNVDERTDLYYVQTTNYGVTWTTAGGMPLTLPLNTTNNPARVFNYSAQGRLMYTCDLNFDTNGNPVLLYITSSDHAPGPQGDPREWTIARWTGSQWLTNVVCTSDHNYDMGSLYIYPDRWVIIGPTQTGPQVWQAGGEMAVWTSVNQGQTWTMTRQITTNSLYNHTYARRPLNAKDPFYVFWADGDPTQVTPSRLYFSNSQGTNIWQMPYDMPTPLATPQPSP